MNILNRIRSVAHHAQQPAPAPATGLDGMERRLVPLELRLGVRAIWRSGSPRLTCPKSVRFQCGRIADNFRMREEIVGALVDATSAH